MEMRGIKPRALMVNNGKCTGKNLWWNKVKDALNNPKIKKYKQLYLEFYWKKIGVGIMCYIEQCSFNFRLFFLVFCMIYSNTYGVFY